MGWLFVVLGWRDTSVNHTDDIYLRVTTIIKRDIATLFRASHDNIRTCFAANNTTCRAALYSRNKKRYSLLQRRACTG